MANAWDDFLGGGQPKVAVPTAQKKTNVWGDLLGGIPVTDVSVPHPQVPSADQQPQIAGFEGIDFAQVSDRDIRNVQRDFIHPSDLDFSLKEVQEKIGQGERQGDFIKLPDTNIFDKYSGALVYLPEDPARLANATAKYPDTELRQGTEEDKARKDLIDKGKLITVTDEEGKESKQFITNRDYYLKRLREGGTNPISAVFTAASVAIELFDDFRRKDFEDMTIQEQMIHNQKTIETAERTAQQRRVLAEQGVTGREIISADYVEPEGFFGQAWEQLVGGFGYQMPRAFGGLTEMLGTQGDFEDLEKWGQEFGDKQLARFLKKPELLPPSDLQSFAEGGAKDPRWYGVAVGSLIPTITTTFGAMIVAGLASGGNPAVIGVAGTSVIFAQESSYAYNNMIDRGIPPQDAADAAMIYGAIAAALEGLSEVRIGKQILSRSVLNATKQSFKRKLLFELPKTIGIESGTEGIQAFTENFITKWLDDEQKLMEGVIDSMASGALGGTMFGGVTLVFDTSIYSNKADAPVTLQTFGAGEKEQLSSAELRDKVRDEEAIFDEEAIAESRALLDYESTQAVSLVETESVIIEGVQYSDDSFSSRIVIEQDGQTFSVPFSGDYATPAEAVVGAVRAAKQLKLSPAILEEIEPFVTIESVEKAKVELLNEIKENRRLIQKEDQQARIDQGEKIKGKKAQFKAVPEDKRLAEVNVGEALEHLGDKQFERWLALRVKEEYLNDNQLIQEAVPAFTALMARGRYNEAAQIRATLPARLTKGVEDVTLSSIKEFMDQQLIDRDFEAAPPAKERVEVTEEVVEEVKKEVKEAEKKIVKKEEKKKPVKKKEKMAEERPKEKVRKEPEIFAEGALPPITKGQLDKKPITVGIEEAISLQAEDVPVGERLESAMKKAYTHIKDEMYPLARIFGEDSNVMDKVRNFSGAAARAEQMLLGEGTFDYETYELNGESLRNIIKDIDDTEERDLKIYLVARREKALQETHPDYKTNILLQEVKEKIKELEKKYPNMKDMGNRIRDFNDRVLQYTIDGGFISEAQGAVIREQNPDYTAPMFRDVENQSGGFLAGAIGKVGNPIKRIKGTLDVDLKIMDPLQNIVKNTYHIMDAVNKNEIKQGIVQAVESNPDLAQFIKKTTPKMVPVGKVEHRAVYDQVFEEKLIGLANRLGLREFQKKGKAGRNLGFYQPAGQLINKKIGTGRDTLGHEVGHFFDTKYGLRKKFDQISQKKSKSKQEDQNKYRELEEMYEHSVVKGETKSRLNKPEEKFANAFSWWMSQRALAERDMPVFSLRMRQAIKEIPELEPLLAIEPSPRPEIETDIEQIFGISFKQPDGIIDVKIDGERKFYEVDMDIYRSLMGLDKQQSNILVEILAAPARLLRAGATLVPEFSLRNPLRDQLTAAINSKNQYVPFVDLAKSLYKMIEAKPEQKELERLYKVAGADYASIVSPDRTSMELAIRDIIKGRGATYYVKHPIDLLRVISEYGETATRIADFEKSLKKFGTKKEGILKAGKEARDLTLNFGKLGATGKVVNRLVAFFNAQLEDLDKIVRMHGKAPVKTVTRALSYVTAPTILLWFINRDDEDYDELPQWRKDLFWNIPTGGDKIKFVAIPKPFGYGLLYGSTVERMLEAMDKGSMKKGFDGYQDTLFRGFLPSIAPTAMVPIVENWANKSTFLDRPIVPQYKIDLEPELQYGRYTSDSAKFIGRVFGYSPAKVENLIRGYTAGLGKYGLDTLDWASNLFVDRPEPPAEGVVGAPVLKAFLTKKPTGFGADSVSKFYELSDDANRALSSYNTLRKTSPERAEKYLAEHSDEIAIAKVMAKMRTELSNLSKERDVILEDPDMSGKEKTIKMDEVDDRILEKAKEFLGRVQDKEFTEGEAKVNAITQTDEKALAEAFNELTPQQKERSLGGMTDSRKSALKRGQEDLIMEKYLASVKDKTISSVSAQRKFEREIAALYEEKKLSSSQKAHVSKLVNEFNIRRTFGADNEVVNDLLSANANADKVIILLKAKEDLGKKEFSYLLRKGRALKLISSNVFKEYIKQSRV